MGFNAGSNGATYTPGFLAAFDPSGGNPVLAAGNGGTDNFDGSSFSLSLSLSVSLSPSLSLFSSFFPSLSLCCFQSKFTPPSFLLSFVHAVLSISAPGPALSVGILDIRFPVLDNTGGVFFSEFFSNCIRRYSSGNLSTVGGQCGNPGTLDGIGTAALFAVSQLVGVCVCVCLDVSL